MIVRCFCLCKQHFSPFAILLSARVWWKCLIMTVIFRKKIMYQLNFNEKNSTSYKSEMYSNLISFYCINVIALWFKITSLWCLGAQLLCIKLLQMLLVYISLQVLWILSPLHFIYKTSSSMKCFAFSSSLYKNDNPGNDSLILRWLLFYLGRMKSELHGRRPCRRNTISPNGSTRSLETPSIHPVVSVPLYFAFSLFNSFALLRKYQNYFSLIGILPLINQCFISVDQFALTMF